MISKDEIIRIAKELHEEGYGQAEAYPVIRWQKRGYPEDEQIFKAIDAYIRFMREYEKYECQMKKSTES